MNLDDNDLFLSRLPKLIDTLAEYGWVVCDDFLTADEAAALRIDGRLRHVQGDFHRAGVGRADGKAVRDDVRGDDVLWLDPSARSEAEQIYWQRIEALQTALNRELFLGIREGEFHYAHYPVGAFYQRHLDRFRDDDARVISVVCYLNSDWQDDQGGHLRLWLDGEGKEVHVDVAPRAGRLVLFRSERFWHAVQPAKRPRWSVTGWMRRG